MITGFLTLWVKLRYGVETKIDTNTQMTKAGTTAAAVNAKAAQQAAQLASNKADILVSKLNGDMDDRIRSIVSEHTDHLVTMFKAHSEQDDKNMAEIRRALGELRDRTK